MRGNRRTGTQPEIALRRLLHRRGLRYRVDYPIILKALRVRPDIVFTRRRLAVFVDGCYWHGCPQHGTQPRTNSEYWQAKIARNQARDVRVSRALRAAGWAVIRVWEHDPPEAVAERITRLLHLQSDAK
jgi:DNA mismatch endonuclease, patch repair protein